MMILEEKNVTMTLKPIKFAIVGTGAIAVNHAIAIAETEGAELLYVTNRSEKSGREFAKKFQCEFTSSLDDLLSRSDVDVVCVTTPSGAHAEVAITAFEAGKHVLCEKPLEISVERVDRIIASAQKNDKILGAIFQSRFGTGARKVKEAIEKGRLGRLTLCSAYVKWWRDNEYYATGGWHGTKALDGGGALINQAIHGVDLLQWLVGMPVKVSAFSGALVHSIEVEDTLVANLQFASGALGSIEAATSCKPGAAKRIEISGDKGTIVLEDDRIMTWEFDDEHPDDEAIRKGEHSLEMISGFADPKAITSEGHRLQVGDLVAAIRENRQPSVSGFEGRNAVQIIEAIYQSAETGRIVEIAS
jgi:predicted dehydrogenase